MTDAERAKIEKTIQGLRAKLNWDHIDSSIKKAYEERIAELLGVLRDGKKETD